MTVDRVRLDKWLWAARFFKTRSQAAHAVKGGHVQVNGQRGKPGAQLRKGDRLHVTKGALRFELDVVDLAEKRGPAAQAQALYEETAASVEAREKAAEQRRIARAAMPRPQRRPDRKQRRQLRRFKQGDRPE